jgi:hypothetical protein
VSDEQKSVWDESDLWTPTEAALLARVKELEAERDRLRKQLRDEESAHEATIRQRDFASYWADRLAAGVGDVEVIGEHSNLNNPWETAYGLMRSLAEFHSVEAERDRLRALLESFVSTLAKRAESVQSTAWYHPDIALKGIASELRAAIDAELLGGQS